MNINYLCTREAKAPLSKCTLCKFIVLRCLFTNVDVLRRILQCQ